MDLISGIPVLGTLVTVVIPFLVVLSIVVFVHEYGHYIVGRWNGIKAEVFSVGFGPVVAGWIDRHGTRWQVAALPLGGYVKFTGDMDPASAGSAADQDLTPEDRKRAFHNASLTARVLTVAAGPAFNFVLAVVLLAMLGMAVGRPTTEPVIGPLVDDAQAIGFVEGDRVVSIDGAPVEGIADVFTELSRLDGDPVPAVVERDGRRQTIEIVHASIPVIADVLPGQPAEAAGVLPNDVVTAVDGKPIRTYYDLRLSSVDKPEGEPVALTVLRDGEERTFTFVPAMTVREHPGTGERKPLPTMGIAGQGVGIGLAFEALGPVDAVVYGVERTWNVLFQTMAYLGRIVAGQEDASQLGGPIGIAKISGQAASAGLSAMVQLIAVISASIGLLNLFPIPVLDGGHLMFYAVEALRGRPVGAAAMRVGNMIGLSLVLLLMVFATYNDLLRI